MAEGDESDDSQKTEDPTPKRLEEARKKGQVALSRELNNWIMLLAATLLISTMAPHFMFELTQTMRVFIEQPERLPQVPGGFSVRSSNCEVARAMLTPPEKNSASITLMRLPSRTTRVVTSQAAWISGSRYI